MSADEKRVTIWALETEVKAVRVSLRERAPRDFNDVRSQHLRLVESALQKVMQIQVEKHAA